MFTYHILLHKKSLMPGKKGRNHFRTLSMFKCTFLIFYIECIDFFRLTIFSCRCVETHILHFKDIFRKVCVFGSLLHTHNSMFLGQKCIVGMKTYAL